MFFYAVSGSLHGRRKLGLCPDGRMNRRSMAKSMALSPGSLVA